MTNRINNTYVRNILRGDIWIWCIYIILLCSSIAGIFITTAQFDYETDTLIRNSSISHIRYLLSGLLITLLLQSKFLEIYAIRTKTLFLFKVKSKHWNHWLAFAITVVISIVAALLIRYEYELNEGCTSSDFFSKDTNSIISDEWGFMHAVLIALLYLLLFIRCFVLSRRTKNSLIRLLILGLPLIICIQTITHISICTRSPNLTILLLPQISHSLPSVICSSISFGIMLYLSRIIHHE